jgi:hypothetical protein
MPIDPRLPLAIAAAVGPVMLAYNVSPSPTFLNQALAIGLWGWFAAQLGVLTPARDALHDTRALLAALGLVAVGVLWSWGPGALPSSLALSALGLLACAAVLAASGAAQRHASDAAGVFAFFCAGWLAAGLLSAAVALVQVFAPGWPDGDWVARSGLVGRAVGNLRQPNHLSSVLLWSAIATVALVDLRRLHRVLGGLLLAVIVFAVVLTASRTGTVGVVLLAAWGLADRRLSPWARALLVAAPVVYAASWFGMAAWASASEHTFGGAARMSEGDLSSSRFGIWANTLALIRQNPWTGVGFGEFNFAWSLTPFPGRPTAFFDHTHNLPLHLLVELGLPLGSLVLALLLWALWRAARAAFTRGGEQGSAQRAAVMMVLLIGLHSLLEYPLWYAYFLLPAAWAWGFALGRPGLRVAAGPSPLLVAGGVLMAVGAMLSVLDYQRVAAVFNAPRNATPLAERIAEGRRSVLFGHHADYAAATTELEGADPTRAFERSTHYLLDTRLMIAWAEALAREGRLDEARHLAARLREFRHPGTQEFFAPCEAGAAASAPPPFQCGPAVRVPRWREFMGD